MCGKFYREIFIKAKKGIDKKLSEINNPADVRNYLENALRDKILEDEENIRQGFNAVKCTNCGVCCRLAVSEFSPDELLRRAGAGDKTAKSFLEVFELHENNILPKELEDYLPVKLAKGAWFYHCKKVESRNGKYFCPIYNKRPAVCRNFPDTPLENLPKSCAYNIWKDNNEVRALFIRALNDIRKFYLETILNGK